MRVHLSGGPDGCTISIKEEVNGEIVEQTFDVGSLSTPQELGKLTQAIFKINPSIVITFLDE